MNRLQQHLQQHLHQRLLLTLLAALTVLPSLRSQGFPVIDVSAIAQAIQGVQLATQKLELAKLELERLGDPKVVKTPAAERLLESLGRLGLEQALERIQAQATGAGGTHFNPSGLYREPTEVLRTVGGEVLPRAVQEYRKFDAVAQAAGHLEKVLADTGARRLDLRRQIQRGLQELQSAASLAEVHKLQGVLGSLQSELEVLDQERESALNRLLSQQILNQTDAARQQVARREETEAAVRQATVSLGQSLKVDTSNVRIPSPR